MQEDHVLRGEQPLRVVHRACAVLELIAETGRALSAAELSTRCGLSSATTHRLLHALTARGYLHQDLSRNFELGPAILRLGTAATRGIASWARQTLTMIAQESGESAYLTCLQGDLVNHLAQAQSAHSMRSCTEIGTQTLPHCTAAGKALLAQLPRQQCVRIFARSGLPSYTQKSITDPNILLAELDSAREAGYAVSNEEHERSENCIAVPVHGIPFISALSVAGPSTRLQLPPQRPIVELLWKAADELAAVHKYVPG